MEGDRAGQVARTGAVTSATAAWVLSAIVNDLSGWPLIATLTAGGLLTAAAVTIPMWIERRARRRAAGAEQIAEDVSARMRLVLDDALEPLAYLIGRITDRPRLSRGRELGDMQGQAKQVVLAAAAEVLGSTGLRACYFKIDTKPPARLVPDGFHGRAQAPRTSFVAGTALGDEALRLLEQREDLFCRDATAEAPPGWDPADHDYRTFIVVPVATVDRAFGIITIDSLRVGDLDETDVAAVRVFARLLAVALNA